MRHPEDPTATRMGPFCHFGSVAEQLNPLNPLNPTNPPADASVPEIELPEEHRG
jgi:hypothetical protein